MSVWKFGITDAVSKKHTQNTDTKLDEGGANEVTAAEAKAANTHIGESGASHSDVGLNTTHRGSAGTDHSDVGLNNTHRSGDGSDHTDVAANTAARHAESHTVASHSDTTGTGAQLNELVGGGATILHSHAGGAGSAPAFFINGDAYVAEDILYIRLGTAFTLGSVIVSAMTAPTDASLIFDVNYHATDPSSMTTVFTTQANRPTITTGNKTATSGAPQVTALAAGGFVGISIDQIGATIPGSKMAVTLVPA